MKTNLNNLDYSEKNRILEMHKKHGYKNGLITEQGLTQDLSQSPQFSSLYGKSKQGGEPVNQGPAGDKNRQMGYVGGMSDPKVKNFYDKAPSCIQQMIKGTADNNPNKTDVITYQTIEGKSGVQIKFTNGQTGLYCMNPNIYYSSSNKNWGAWVCEGNTVKTIYNDELASYTFLDVNDAIKTYQKSLKSSENLKTVDQTQISSKGQTGGQSKTETIGNTEQDLQKGKYLYVGSRGDFVKKVQLAIVNTGAEGYMGMFTEKNPTKNPIDGIFGNTTAKVVKEFQKDYGIKPADGKVRQSTWDKLKTYPTKIVWSDEKKNFVYQKDMIQNLPTKRVDLSGSEDTKQKVDGAVNQQQRQATLSDYDEKIIA